MAKLVRRSLLGLAVLLIAFGCWLWLATMPVGTGSDLYVRYEKAYPVSSVLADLENRHLLKSPAAAETLAWITKHSRHVAAGTYQIGPQMSAREVLEVLGRPMKQLVRLPESNWARRSANLLEESQVCKAEEYMEQVANPQSYAAKFDFPITGTTLEGYLFPDTYDLPPLLGAEAVVQRQLEAFDRKVWKPLHPKDLRRTLTVASMIELETRLDSERPIVAGVIENRLARKMPLQLDATVLYARQKWGLLTIKELKQTISPYNTYLHKGLPPGPVCSPSVKSIEAAMHPAKHEYLYYVAMPDGHQVFAKTFAEHEHNIRLRKLAMGTLGKEPVK